MLLKLIKNTRLHQTTQYECHLTYTSTCNNILSQHSSLLNPLHNYLTVAITKLIKKYSSLLFDQVLKNIYFTFTFLKGNVIIQNFALKKLNKNFVFTEIEFFKIIV